jgi:hypothetical protein
MDILFSRMVENRFYQTNINCPRSDPHLVVKLLDPNPVKRSGFGSPTLILCVKYNVKFFFFLLKTLLLFTVLSIVQLKIEETSRRLRSGDLGIPGLEDRFDIFSN